MRRCTGALAVLGLIAVALLVHIMNWLPIAINAAYMLFLTVTTAPLLQGGEDFPSVVMAVLVGCAYFGALAFAAARFAPKPAAPAVAASEA